jgi:quercetin dioxygenase-like cupin family protein
MAAGAWQCAPAPRAEAGPALATPSPRITRVLLDRQDISDRPSVELRAYLVEYAPGASAERHVHPVAGTGYVLEGSFESAFGDEAPSVTRQGQSFVDRANEVHRVFRNASSTEKLRFVVTYAVAKGAEVFLPVPSDRKVSPMSSDNAAGSSAGAPSPAAAAPGVRRTLLESQALADMPGWELRLLLVEYAPGVAADPHTHPVPGIGYVLDGSFESAWGEGTGGEVTVKHKGESFIDLAHQRHLFRNASTTQPLCFIMAYVIPKGAPTVAPA